MRVSKSHPIRVHYIQRKPLSCIDRMFIRPPKPHSQLNQEMFREDFGRIFNNEVGGEDDLFEVVSNDEPLTLRLLASIQTRGYTRSESSIISRVVEEVANSILIFGKAVYYLTEKPGEDFLEIAPYSAHNILNVFGLPAQYLAPNDVPDWEDGTVRDREIRFLDGRQTMIFCLSTRLRKILKRQNSALVVLDRYSATDVSKFFQHSTYQTPNPRTDFEFLEWQKQRDLLFFRSTAATGWNGRRAYGENFSDFFQCFRMLRFKRFQIELRDDILFQLAVGLKKLGRNFNPAYEIDLVAADRLPQIAEADLLKSRLEREEIDFDEIINFCFRV